MQALYGSIDRVVYQIECLFRKTQKTFNLENDSTYSAISNLLLNPCKPMPILVLRQDGIIIVALFGMVLCVKLYLSIRKGLTNR